MYFESRYRQFMLLVDPYTLYPFSFFFWGYSNLYDCSVQLSLFWCWAFQQSMLFGESPLGFRPYSPTTVSQDSACSRRFWFSFRDVSNSQLQNQSSQLCYINVCLPSGFLDSGEKSTSSTMSLHIGSILPTKIYHWLTSNVFFQWECAISTCCLLSRSSILISIIFIVVQGAL